MYIWTPSPAKKDILDAYLVTIKLQVRTIAKRMLTCVYPTNIVSHLIFFHIRRWRRHYCRPMTTSSRVIEMAHRRNQYAYSVLFRHFAFIVLVNENIVNYVCNVGKRLNVVLINYITTTMEWKSFLLKMFAIFYFILARNTAYRWPVKRPKIFNANYFGDTQSLCLARYYGWHGKQTEKKKPKKVRMLSVWFGHMTVNWKCD